MRGDRAFDVGQPKGGLKFVGKDRSVCGQRFLILSSKILAFRFAASRFLQCGRFTRALARLLVAGTGRVGLLITRFRRPWKHVVIQLASARGPP